ncbi:hypothetical protein PV396_39330 [Streptomyces sp. ME02-8801-2C]|uniref:hypothetical protein n=1 Tax=Streptomyces sp. ME02-8801-2C TaxID=3028680 RepID=UPI0029A94984|nr:hypothetical protein [Streptomyces sp. ME02-8801-2C]MDX3457938.1 hypothetical protein [Streptomyces sp. ME02-8801-2C]
MDSPVAASYDELQSLPALFKAATEEPTPARGSTWQALQALFQAMEVGLNNLAALAAETVDRLRREREAEAVRSLEWMVGFGTLWNELAWLVRELAPLDEDAEGHALAVTDSPAWRHLAAEERILAQELKPLADHSEASEWKQLVLRYVMLQRVALEHSCVGGAPYGYQEFVRPEVVRAAVRERQLPGETVFMQFRAAHQMPELLTRAVNDHIERAVAELEAGRTQTVPPLLLRAERLLGVVARMTDLLVDTMETAEYHRIRDALGLTSGSHSVGLHFELMRDLFPALARASEGKPEDIRRLTRTIGLHIDRWRLGHINLPRTNLGGAGTGTRSLTGSPDALRTVAKMREAGRARDPYANDGRAFRATEWDSDTPPLAEVERRLLREISRETQERFQDVQERTGRYSDPSVFTAPAKRCPTRPM